MSLTRTATSGTLLPAGLRASLRAWRAAPPAGAVSAYMYINHAHHESHSCFAHHVFLHPLVGWLVMVASAGARTPDVHGT